MSAAVNPVPETDPVVPMAPVGPAGAPPSLRVAVVIERRARPSAWEDWRYSIDDVLVDDGQFGDTPRCLRDDGARAQYLHPGLTVTLHRDEGEGYYLNLTSGAPVWFVMWRLDEDDPSRAAPELVTLSYNEAGRLLDAQERVDNVPLPAGVRDWLQAWTDAHYRPEPKKRRRPASFVDPARRAPRGDPPPGGA